MTSDLSNILQWWVILLSLGLIFSPITTLIFRSFWDKGYFFSKILALLLLSYSIWLLSSTHILPFNTLSLLLLLGLFLALNVFIAAKKKTSTSLIQGWKIIVFEEIFFLTGLVFWSYIRGFEPSIYGLEKYMDFGFVNSILRAEYFPPKDLWLTPFPINYYYFGHLTVAVLTKLSGIPSVISYNLTLATLFAVTLSASFSIAANFYRFFLVSQNLPLKPSLRQLFIAGLLGSFLVTLGGNLHPIYAFFKAYPAENPLPFWNLSFDFNFSDYWYPNATRFIPFTIHEFPIYSFVVSDLHGHVLNIPFILLLLALLTKIFFQAKLLTYDFLLLGLLIAISLTTNVLDGPIYLLVIFLVLFTLQLKTAKITKALLSSLKSILIIGTLALIFSLPFWTAFKPFASGVGVLCAPEFLTKTGRFGPFLFEADHCARSPFWMLLILWGFFYIVVFGFLLFVTKLPKYLKSLRLLNSADLLVLTLALSATLLILIPEFFYVKDIYPAHYRANTVFKFGYQAFIILGLISGYMIIRLISNLKNQKSKLSSYFFLTFTFLLFVLVAIYPYFAVNSYYGNLKNYQGLNGLNYLNRLYPADYQAILWLQKNISGQPIILEAQGDSYTDFARVSSNTGLPTVVGWPVHEWLWRGSYDEAGKRSGEVSTLYESPDINLTKQLLKKYNVSYVFIGALEKQKYTKLNEEKFATLGKVIYQSGGTKVYQIL